MVTLEYTIKSKLGIHARPAGYLSRLAKEFEDCDIFCRKADSQKEYDVKNVFAFMGAQFKCGDDVVFKIDSKGKYSESLIKDKLQSLLEKHC